MTAHIRDFAAEAVAAIKRNKRETLVFYVENFRGQDLGHIRIAVQNAEGRLIPTGKGITLTREQLAAFAEGVAKLSQALGGTVV